MFLMLALDGQYHIWRLYFVKRNLCTSCIEGWVGLRISVDAVETRNISSLNLESNSGRPSRKFVIILTKRIWVTLVDYVFQMKYNAV
jgi:hypothetical protein